VVAQVAHLLLPLPVLPAVWVYCGDKDKCGEHYQECWLKYLVGAAAAAAAAMLGRDACWRGLQHTIWAAIDSAALEMPCPAELLHGLLILLHSTAPPGPPRLCQARARGRAHPLDIRPTRQPQPQGGAQGQVWDRCELQRRRAAGEGALLPALPAGLAALCAQGSRLAEPRLVWAAALWGSAQRSVPLQRRA
jgi:hypothetical protein